MSSLADVVDEVLIVDSFSSDDTVSIAEAHGSRVVLHTFVNQAKQFNWALTQLSEDTDWVLRIDADEFLTSMLSTEIKQRLSEIGHEIDGVYFDRRMTFQGCLIRFGGVFVDEIR